MPKVTKEQKAKRKELSKRYDALENFELGDEYDAKLELARQLYNKLLKEMQSDDPNHDLVNAQSKRLNQMLGQLEHEAALSLHEKFRDLDQQGKEYPHLFLDKDGFKEALQNQFEELQKALKRLPQNIDGFREQIINYEKELKEQISAQDQQNDAPSDAPQFLLDGGASSNANTTNTTSSSSLVTTAWSRTAAAGTVPDNTPPKPAAKQAKQMDPKFELLQRIIRSASLNATDEKVKKDALKLFTGSLKNKNSSTYITEMEDFAKDNRNNLGQHAEVLMKQLDDMSKSQAVQTKLNK